MVQTEAVMLENQLLAPGYHLIRVAAPAIARAAQPGQFLQVRRSLLTEDPLLSRPISIYRVDQARGEVSLIFRIVGRGTELLAQATVGDTLGLLGPAGTAFAKGETAQRVALIAGGIGMPPLYFFAHRLKEAAPQKDLTLFYGAAGATDLLELTAWQALQVPVYTATMDGSKGAQGLVTDLFMTEHQGGRQPFDYLVACGPEPMLKAVADLGKSLGIPGQVSLEAHMACGVGACLGCVCQTKQGYQRVCVEGPVFNLGEVTF